MDDIHGQNYPIHLEVIVTLFSILLLGFGMYNITYGQINPAKDPANGTGVNVYDPKIINGTNLNNSGKVNGVYNPVTKTVLINGVNYPVNQVNNPVSPAPLPVYNATANYYTYPNQNRGRATAPKANTNTNTNTGANTNNTNSSTTGDNGGFNDDIGYQSVGSYIGPTNGASYNQGGEFENNGIQTQGLYLNTANSSIYGPNGLNEELAQPSLISAPTNSNVNFKNCSAFTKYHAFGDRGGDVGAIQMFLKEKGYYKGKIDGVYGITTFKAVQAFQKDYADQILDPWEIKNQKPTGKWYKSTRKKANQIMGCPEPAVYLERVNKILEY